jgi:hypothetical protein
LPCKFKPHLTLQHFQYVIDAQKFIEVFLLIVRQFAFASTILQHVKVVIEALGRFEGNNLFGGWDGGKEVRDFIEQGFSSRRITHWKASSVDFRTIIL